jgi:hypothetical protein
MRRLLALAIGVALALHPARAVATSAWGSPGYGDPPGWCTNFSDMWVATVVTNDPHVGTNPERNTFYGFHPNPGYDDWYGYFYGDFRGSPGDSSGWVKLLHESYPDHYHWNFATNGWAVHGHAKQYIAYYNWTFGGQCGIGTYGNNAPPAFMADQYGYPVVDIYVDSMPPFAPHPRVTGMTTGSVSFTWDPVGDQGDGAGRDFFSSGFDHFASWTTVGGSPKRLQVGSTNRPRSLTQVDLGPRQMACVHVIAYDRLSNASPERTACSGPLVPPPMPTWNGFNSRVVANPAAPGLVGLDSWFWLSPAPSPVVVDEAYQGIHYLVTATATGADWGFGDGATGRYFDAAGFGEPFPLRSAVTHTYQAHRQSGYPVQASVRFEVTWTAVVGGRSVGPYPLGVTVMSAGPLQYRVEQAQPELIQI